MTVCRRSPSTSCAKPQAENLPRKTNRPRSGCSRGRSLRLGASTKAPRCWKTRVIRLGNPNSGSLRPTRRSTSPPRHCHSIKVWARTNASPPRPLSERQKCSTPWAETSEASEALSSFLKKNPSSGEAALKLAEIRLELGDPGAAIDAPVGRGILSATATRCGLPRRARLAGFRRIRKGRRKAQNGQGSACSACRWRSSRVGRMPVAAGRMPARRRKSWKRISRRTRVFPACLRLLRRSTESMSMKGQLRARSCAGGRRTPKMDNARLSPYSTWRATKRVRARARRAGSFSAISSPNIQATSSRMRRALSFPRHRLPRAVRRRRCRPRKRAGAFVTASCADRRKPPADDTRRPRLPFCKPLARLSWRPRHLRIPPFALCSRASRKPKTKRCVD